MVAGKTLAAGGTDLGVVLGRGIRVEGLGGIIWWDVAVPFWHKLWIEGAGTLGQHG